MNGTIEEVHLRRPICDECGPLGPLREEPLSTAENTLGEHFLRYHGNDEDA